MEVFGLLALLALGWFWLDSLRTRDCAIEAVRAACAAESLQLLDDTVSQQQLRLERNAEGHLRFRRLYRFDYSDTGDNRRRGSVLLLGQRVVELHLKPRLIPSDRVLH